MFSSTLSGSLLPPTNIDDLLFSWSSGLSREEDSKDKESQGRGGRHLLVIKGGGNLLPLFEATDPCKKINEEWIYHAHVAYLIAFPCRFSLAREGRASAFGSRRKAATFRHYPFQLAPISPRFLLSPPWLNSSRYSRLLSSNRSLLTSNNGRPSCSACGPFAH
ncbi:hypothetical protein OPV22_027811 [Ensete ventricosum]|uniref:Uncharacterized protein n=1 Tax=Ensete ventricosum TaxID=4639 RepID=A0AAV8Q1N4_ENSVE|nr:hypothetical protein OPV22_027811 [Ensete ventricosum]